MHFDEFRREYTAGGLTRDMLDPHPLRQLEHWLEQAVRAGLEDPTGMVGPRVRPRAGTDHARHGVGPPDDQSARR